MRGQVGSRLARLLGSLAKHAYMHCMSDMIYDESYYIDIMST